VVSLSHCNNNNRHQDAVSIKSTRFNLANNNSLFTTQHSILRTRTNKTVYVQSDTVAHSRIQHCCGNAKIHFVFILSHKRHNLRKNIINEDNMCGFYCCTVHFDNIKILFTNKCTLY